jgi:hypothetical protein
VPICLRKERRAEITVEIAPDFGDGLMDQAAG